MKLNIEKLKDKLKKIDRDVYVEIKKQYYPELNYYFNVIQFNNLIDIHITDTDNIKDNIERFNCHGRHFRISDFDDMRTTLDFIENNEQAIKTAMLESIEE